ncbi:MAG TPA: carbohydrate-binding domain-containing protein [Herpetosiphonaceae bacterium]
MNKPMSLVTTGLLVLALSACSGTPVESVTEAIPAQSTAVVTSDSTSAGATTSIDSATPTPAAASVAAANVEQTETHDAVEDYEWDDSAAIPITLSGDSIGVDGDGVTVDGSTATITAAGTYSLSGTLADGQIIVDTQDEAIVRLILNGVDLKSSTSAPIYIMNAEKAMIVLADNTENAVTDAASPVFAATGVDEPNAAVFSAADLTITGNGSLTVDGTYNDGIAGKDGLVIAGGTIAVDAIDDGIRGKDYLVVKDGNITVSAQGDGLKADNAEDAGAGYIAIADGVVKITAGGDAIAAETDVQINDGEFTLVSGGGKNGVLDAETSAKGIKGVVSVQIDGGTFTIDAADDALHSNGSLTINGGTLALASGDDGAHADATLTINGGDIDIGDSYEGIESAVITINDGKIQLVSSDDGVNVAGGNDGSGMGGRMGGRPGQAGSQDTFIYSGNDYLYINGGTLVVDSAGDGLDANGAIEMTGGVVLVNGPTERMNGALDYDGGFKMSGGLLVAAGSSGMAQAPGTYSSQNSLLISYTTAQAAGTLVHIQNSAGEEILTFAPAKDYQSLAVSSPALVAGETYTVYSGGSATGSATAGWYQDATYTAGTEYASATLVAGVTTIGTPARFGR